MSRSAMYGVAFDADDIGPCDCPACAVDDYNAPDPYDADFWEKVEEDRRWAEVYGGEEEPDEVNADGLAELDDLPRREGMQRTPDRYGIVLERNYRRPGFLADWPRSGVTGDGTRTPHQKRRDVRDRRNRAHRVHERGER